MWAGGIPHTKTALEQLDVPHYKRGSSRLSMNITKKPPLIVCVVVYIMVRDVPSRVVGGIHHSWAYPKLTQQGCDALLMYVGRG